MSELYGSIGTPVPPLERGFLSGLAENETRISKQSPNSFSGTNETYSVHQYHGKNWDLNHSHIWMFNRATMILVMQIRATQI